MLGVDCTEKTIDCLVKLRGSVIVGSVEQRFFCEPPQSLDDVQDVYTNVVTL